MDPSASPPGKSLVKPLKTPFNIVHPIGRVHNYLGRNPDPEFDTSYAPNCQVNKTSKTKPEGAVRVGDLVREASPGASRGAAPPFESLPASLGAPSPPERRREDRPNGRSIGRGPPSGLSSTANSDKEPCKEDVPD